MGSPLTVPCIAADKPVIFGQLSRYTGVVRIG
jgi:hypothetical protein